MRRTEALQGGARGDVFESFAPLGIAELNQAEAAGLLGVSERTFRRWRDRYDEAGEAGLVDRRLGKASGKRVPVDRAEEVGRLYRERDHGFTVKSCYEHSGEGSRLWVGLHLDEASLCGIRRKPSVMGRDYRRPRARRRAWTALSGEGSSRREALLRLRV
jgi:hypothetical protein